MGYTHYWSINPKGNQAEYEKAKADIRKILERKPVKLGEGMGERCIREDDYSSDISFNGMGEDSHETFSIPDKLSDLKPRPWETSNSTDFVFSFCKTNEKPYDKVVTACLTVLKYYLKKDIDISSDGGEDGFSEGMALAEYILGRPFQNPSSEVDTSVELIN